MSNLSIDDIELALSLGVDPDDSGPLSDERRKELEAQLGNNGTETETEHEQAVGAAVSQDAIAAATEQIMARLAAAGAGATPAAAQGVSPVEAFLASVDPRDSETHLALMQFLIDNQRMQVIGTLAGGGYMFHYAEPKGTTKEGYIPGATKGGRMVDQALEQAKASGAKPRKTGICDKCWSAVEQHDDGSVTTEDGSTACSSGGTHNFNG